MGKVKYYSINPRERFRIIGEFFEIIAGLRVKKEVVAFLVGLLTPSEALMLARRIQIAKMLLEEKNYENIRKKLKVSNQTINKVEHWLRSDQDKNELIIKKLKKTQRNDMKRGGRKKVDRASLDKYAHHRIWKNLLK